MSIDDKARVPIGLTAAKSQAPMLMHMEYKVKLPDHDFVIAGRHKLIPSVYAICNITNRGLTYSGPTYIAIRSAKHDKSSANSHDVDIETILKNACKLIITNLPF